MPESIAGGGGRSYRFPVFSDRLWFDSQKKTLLEALIQNTSWVLQCHENTLLWDDCLVFSRGITQSENMLKVTACSVNMPWPVLNIMNTIFLIGNQALYPHHTIPHSSFKVLNRRIQPALFSRKLSSNMSLQECSLTWKPQVQLIQPWSSLGDLGRSLSKVKVSCRTKMEVRRTMYIIPSSLVTEQDKNTIDGQEHFTLIDILLFCTASLPARLPCSYCSIPVLNAMTSKCVPVQSVPML